MVKIHIRASDSLRFSNVGLPEKFFNEINMCHDHSATAIALAAKLIHSISG
jgi:hypothetical protein